jgi:hypothetical protein
MTTQGRPLTPEEDKTRRLGAVVASFMDDIETITAQRDALLAACKAAIKGLENMTSDGFSKGKDRPIRDQLRAAVKLAEHAPATRAPSGDSARQEAP